MDRDQAYAVQGMTCGHCVDAITKQVIQIPGVAVAHLDLDQGMLWVQGHPEPLAVERAVTELG